MAGNPIASGSRALFGVVALLPTQVSYRDDKSLLEVCHGTESQSSATGKLEM